MQKTTFRVLGSGVPRLNSLRSFSAKNFTPVPSAGATGQAGLARFSFVEKALNVDHFIFRYVKKINPPKV